MSSQLNNGGSENEELKTSTSDTTIDGDENYSHQRRQQRLEEAREHALNIRMDARGQAIEGAITHTDQLAYYRGAVEGYVIEAIGILDRDEVELSKDYLEQVHLGTVRFEPPAELVEIGKENIEQLAPGAEIPTPSERDVFGLRSLLEAPSPLLEEFAVVLLRNGNTEEITRTVPVEIPQHVLDRAIEVTDKALAEAGVGVELSESSSNVWEFREINDVDDVNPDTWDELRLGENGKHHAREEMQ